MEGRVQGREGRRRPPVILWHASSASNRLMRVVHVLAAGLVGGLERVVTALAGAQRRAGSDARVVAVTDAGTPEPEAVAALRNEGVPVLTVPLPPRAYRLERRRLGEALKAMGPDVVHTHGYRADVQGEAVARALGVATVTTVHGFTGGGLKNRLYELLQRRAFRRFGAVVAVSKPLGAELAASGVPAARVHVIPNAAPEPRVMLDRGAARRELALPDGGFVLGWVGRLSLEKGPDILVEALPLLPPDITAVVIGAGRAAGMLEQLAAARGVAGRVRWCGLVPDAGRLFAAFDCFVLSSRTEGTPIVLFEAMAAGTPIVATAVGGVPDVLSPREAVLVSSGDPGALAAAIASVREDPAGARGRAEAARHRLAEERRLEPWVAQYDAVYRHLAASRSHSSA